MIKKLTKDTLIEGNIIEKGTKIVIKESYTYDHDKGIIYMTRDQYRKAHSDFKGRVQGHPTHLAFSPKYGTTAYNVEFID